MMRCATCKYWSTVSAGNVPIQDVRHGECRRTPPHLIDDSVRGVWPHTTAEDWCGEFEDSGREEP